MHRKPFSAIQLVLFGIVISTALSRTDAKMVFTFGCNACEGTTSAATFHRCIAQVANALPPDVRESIGIESIIFDIGPGGGTKESLGQRFDDLVATNSTLLVLVPVVDLVGTIDVLKDVHAVLPHFHAAMYNNDLPPSNNLDWLVHLGVRWDEIGYMMGYIAGVLTESSRVSMRMYGAYGWAQRARANAFGVGVEDACPHCISDLIVASSVRNLSYGWDDFVARGDDVFGVTGGLTANDDIFINATFAKFNKTNLKFVYGLFEAREQWPLEIQNAMPYVVRHVGDDVVERIVMNLITEASTFPSGTLLMSVTNGAMPLLGCAGPASDEPCLGANIPRVKHDAIVRRHQEMTRGEVHTGVLLSNDAFLARLAPPALVPYTARNLSDHFGDSFANLESPIPLHLADYKITMLAPPFTRMWSLVYAASAMTHFPTPPEFARVLGHRRRFAAASFGTFAVVFGGHCELNILHDDLIHVQTPCWVETEKCLMNPQTRVLSRHPLGARFSACVAAIANDAMFLHGGVDEFGTVLRDTWLFNFTTQQWSQVATASFGRYSHTCTPWHVAKTAHPAPIQGRCVVVAGGLGISTGPIADVSVYCLEQNTWSTTHGLRTGCTTGIVFPCVFTTAHRAYLFGGQLEADNDQHANHDRSDLWALSSAAVWVPSTSSWDARTNATGPVNWPKGPMQCTAVTEMGGTPHRQAVPGPRSPRAVREMIRIYTFRLNNSGDIHTASSSGMQLVTVPWISCAEGLTLAADGFGCIDSVRSDTHEELALWKLAVIIAASAVAGAGFVLLIALSVRYVITNHRRNEKLRLVPKGKILAFAAVSVQRNERSRGDTSSPQHSFYQVADMLKRIAQRCGVYEVQRFGDTLLYAVDNPERMVQMTREQFEYVYDPVMDLSTVFSLRVSVDYGHTQARHVEGTMTKVIYKGRAVRSVFSMLQHCPEHEVVCSQRAHQHLKAGSLHDFHVSDLAKLRQTSRGIDESERQLFVVYLRPQCTADVRGRALITFQRAGSKSNLQNDSSCGSQPQQEHKRTSQVFEERVGLSKLILREMFCSLRRQRPTAHRRLLSLLCRRFYIPMAPPCTRHKDAAHSLVLMSTAVCSAIVREIEVPLEVLLSTAAAASHSMDGRESNPLRPAKNEDDVEVLDVWAGDGAGPTPFSRVSPLHDY